MEAATARIVEDRQAGHSAPVHDDAIWEAVLAGESSAAVSAHLDECPECAALATALQTIREVAPSLKAKVAVSPDFVARTMARIVEDRQAGHSAPVHDDAIREAVPTPAVPPSPRPVGQSIFERGRGVGALRRGPLEPRSLSGLPWWALCVLTILAWLIAGRGVATAFLVVGLVGVVLLLTLRSAEWSISVLRLRDRRRRRRGVS